MRKSKILGVTLIAFLLGGCVTGTRNITLTAPDYDAGKSASGAIYIGEIRDGRQFEQKPAEASTPSVKGKLDDASTDRRASLIGRQRNGYGKAMGDVALPEGGTIQSVLKDVLTKALEGRGYQVTNDASAARKIDVDVEKFWAWFRPGMWVVSFDSEVMCTLHWSGPGASHDIAVAGKGVNKGQIASDANWMLTYERAFDDFLKNLDNELDAKGL